MTSLKEGWKRLGRKSSCFVVLLIVLSCAEALSVSVEWVPSGYSGGGRYTIVTIDPFDHRRVLVGSDVAGIFLSTDEGESFSPSGKGLEGFNVADIAFFPHEQGRVMVITDNGLHVSSNGGQDWLLVSKDIKYSKRCCPGHLFAFGRNVIYVGSDRGVFSLSVDKVKSKYTQLLPGLENHPINAVALHGETLFVGTDRGVYSYEGSWQPQNEGFINDGTPIVIDLLASSDGQLYAVEKSSGLYLWSGDRWLPRPIGATVESLYRPRYFKALGVHPLDSALVILGTHPDHWPHRLFMSRDRGLSWSMLENFNIHPRATKNWATGPVGIESISFSKQNPKTIFISDWWNIWKSSDGGESWYTCYSGLQNTVVNDIKQNPNDPALLYAAVADNGLMVSPDSGQTWERWMDGLPEGHAQEVEISKTNPNKIYLLLNPWNKEADRVYIYRSLDGGRSWRDISFKTTVTLLSRSYQVTGDATSLELDPESDDIVYVATNGRGIYRTTNGGISWLPIHYGLSNHHVKTSQGLVTVPGRPGLLYVSTLGGGVYKSNDRGDHWQQVFSREPMTFGLAVKPSADNVRIVVGCAKKRVALSEDGGKSWRVIDLPGDKADHLATYAVAFDPSNPDVILAATEGYDFKPADGLFMSRDGGKKFEQVPMPTNIPRLSIFSILFSSSDRVYIGFNGLGIYRVMLK
ncbi:MAG: hypothetical protein N2260_10375 [Syntrophobacterales bacterium]|nr:hypothetical protein [Syntrophobacterales bacterium]